METMNYNRDNKKDSKSGIICFALFTCIGVASVTYMISNEPKPQVIGQDMYVPVVSENTNKTDNPEVNVYTEQEIANITYDIKKDSHVVSKGKFKSNIAVPQISINGEKLDIINEEILNKFITRYNAVKKEADNLENSFTYKVTYNKYESNVNNNRILSFTFYERIIDDYNHEDVTYKLYGYSIDLVNKKVYTQQDVANVILGSTYKTILKDRIKEFAINKKLFSDSNYTYSLTGFEEFYVKNEELHIMFNPGEMGNNKDYLDIVIEN